MDVFEVNIYLETSVDGPQRAKLAAGEWIAAYITPRKKLETRQGLIVRENTTGNALTLELLHKALSELGKTCQIQVNTCNQYLISAMQNRWLPRWRENGWITARGEPVKNMELWQQVSEKMDSHFVEFVSHDHEYRNVMRADIKRALDK